MIGQILNDRYRVLEKLGEGAMGQVYLAEDLERQHKVAVKILRDRIDHGLQKRFAGEFRAISSVDHPNCVKVYDFGETPTCLFFTMEVFRGAKFTALHGQDVDTLLSAVYQAASAIGHVHAQGIIHRDVKPSNILARLIERDGEGRQVEVKLADFGLARFSGYTSSVSGQAGFLGTVQYCAPEQLEGGTIDHRADLYSLGAVCYETLAGHLPLEGEVGEVVTTKLTEDLPRLVWTDPPLPADVLDLVMALVARDPADRPQSAVEVCDVLGPLIGITGDGPKRLPNTSMLTQTRFMGRSNEVQLLRSVIHDSLSPHAHTLSRASLPVIFITGDAGIGKSEVLRQAGRLARRQGAAVYDGRSFQGNLSPYQPFVDILRQFLAEVGDKRRVGHTAHRSVSDQTTVSGDNPGGGTPGVGSLVEDYSAEILRIAPDLRRWIPGEAFKQVDPSRETNYVLRAVASFFVELATLRGTCLLLEDLHWADQSTVDLLRHLVSGLNRSRRLSVERKSSFPRMVLCCTARSEDAEIMQFIGQLRQEHGAQLLELGPFGSDEVRELIGMLLSSPVSQLPDPFTETLRYRCQGNPFFLTQIIRAWQTDGVLARSDGEWSVELGEESGSTWPDSVRELLRTRLGTLTEAAEQVLAPCAVVGSQVDIAFLRELCADIAERNFLFGIEELISHRILFESPEERRLEFVHDLMHELAYDELSAVRKLVLHANVGELLEARRARELHSSPDLLAFHFSRAANDDKALDYLLEAAEGALEAYAMEDAIRYLEQAEDLLHTNTGQEVQFRVYDLLGTAHSAAGNTSEASDFYERSLPLAEDAIERATIFNKIGELHYRIGDYDASLVSFDQSLMEIGRPQPKSMPAVIASIVSTFSIYFLPRWLRFRRRPGEAVSAELVVERDAYRRIPFIWAQRDMVRTLQAVGRQWLLARRIGKPTDLADAYGLHALFFGIFALKPLAKWAGDRAVDYARQVADPEVLAVATGNVGCAYYSAARLDEAESTLRSALQVVERRGDSFDRAWFVHHLRHLYAIRGDFANEAECAQIEIDIGESANHQEGASWGHFGLADALARVGDHVRARASMQEAKAILGEKKDIVVVPTAMQTYGFVLLQAGEYEQARQVLEESVALIEGNLVYLDYAIRAYPLLVESILGPTWHDRSTVAPDDVDRAWRLSRRSLFWCKRLPNYLPHAYRVKGRAAYCRGRSGTARRLLRRAIGRAEAIGAEYDLARSCLDLSKIHEPDREELAARAGSILKRLGATVPAPEE